MKNLIVFLLFFIITLSHLTGCSYRFGWDSKKIPGGYTLLAVPEFQNKTKNTGIESFFTKSLIDEIERSKLAKVTIKEDSQAIIEGTITQVDVNRGAEVTNTTQGFNRLPDGATLAKEYRVVVQAVLTLKRSSDLKILWTGSFSGERRYPAALVTRDSLNTVNPLYNHSALVQSIRLLSKDVMAEAYDQMVENF